MDFIKWMCEKAEGFSIDYRYYNGRLNPYFMYCSGKSVHTVLLENAEQSITYPLLLQRAIEGWADGARWIRVEFDGISIYENVSLYGEKEESRHEADNIDQAKESALLYVYGQE